MTIGGGGAEKVPQSKYEKELARIAAEKWLHFKDKYRPVENQYIDRILSLTSEPEAQDLRGQAVGAVEARSPAVTQMVGDRVSGGDFARRLNKSALETAKYRSSGTTAADISTEQRGVQGKLSLTRLGRNMEDMAIGGLTRSAAIDTQMNIADAYAKQQADAMRYNAYGTVAGAAASGLYASARQKPQLFGPDSVPPPKMGPDGWPVY